MAFDADLFMNQTIDKPLETERTLIKPGSYTMIIDDFDSKAVEAIDFTYKKGDRAGEKGVMYKFSVPCVIQDAEVQAELEREKVVVFKNITLDLDSNGQLEWGKNKNIDLGQLRNAVGQNGNGPWSIANLKGAGPFVGKVDHRSGKRQDGSDFTIAEVGRVAPLR